MPNRQKLIAIGILPPPVNGKVMVTDFLFDRINSTNPGGVKFITGVIGAQGQGGLWTRARMTCRIFYHALYRRLRGAKSPIYLVAEGGGSIFVTALQAFLLRGVASPLVIHHHGRYWLQHGSKILKRYLFSRSDVHITQCEAMSRMLRDTYGDVQTLTLTNAFVSDTNHVPSTRVDSVFQLAHLSNLTMQKGLARVIATFEALKRSGASVRLRIGGEPQTVEAAALLQDAIARHPEIEWLGHVRLDEKDYFFRDVDVFLFPSLYPMETEGIVTLEAMARWIPVIATDLCCLKGNISGSGGKVISSNQDFIAEAADLIRQWYKQPDLHLAARQAARRRFEELRNRSEVEISAILGLLGVIRSNEAGSSERAVG